MRNSNIEICVAFKFLASAFDKKQNRFDIHVHLGRGKCYTKNVSVKLPFNWHITNE